MRITAETALQRLKQNKGDSILVNRVMSRSGEPSQTSEELELVRRVVRRSEDRAFLFKDGNTVFLSPADDVLPPVLAEFEVDNDDSEVNPLALSWIANIGSEIAWLLDHNYPGYERNTSLNSDNNEESQEEEESNENTEEEANANTSDIEEQPEFIDKLLGNIQWLLQTPFKDHNYYKVMQSTTRSEVGGYQTCVVGCPAIATAQVLFYLYKIGYTFGCVNTPSYVSGKLKGYRFSIPKTDPCIKFDFANMLDRYTKRKKNSKGQQVIVNYDSSNPPTTTQKNAVAQLCAHIGKAGKTMYSPKASGMWMDDLSNVLRAGLGIQNTYYSLTNIKNYTDEDFDRIKNSLRAGLPVIMSGSSSGNGAHCFICDGYREEDDTYHFNWGYGPNYGDGWYKMTTLATVDAELFYEEIKDYTGYAQNRDYIIINPKGSPADPWIYDLNKDGFINMLDVTKAINIMNSAYITKKIESGTKIYGNCIRPVRDGIPSSSEHGYVDFELPSGTIWATSNVGAYEDPYDSGDFIGWLRTEGYGDTCPSKYETIDYSNVQQLDASHDAATVRWGDGWRTPTKADWKELMDYCSFEITYEQGPTRRACIKVSRRRETPQSEVPDGFILLPTGGQIVKSGLQELRSGFYWTSTNANTSGKQAYWVRFDCILPKASDVTLADVNYDGVVDTADVQAIIDYILGRNR